MNSPNNILANSAAVLAASFSSPTAASVIPLSAASASPASAADARPVGRGVRIQDIATTTIGPSENISQNKISVPATFKLVFLTITGITVVAGLGQVLMAMEWDKVSANQQSVFEAAGFAWKTGIGAIFGLLGGKVIQ